MFMANKHGDFIWYELLTTQADAACAFYSSILGWVSNDSGQAGMDYRILTMAGEGVGGLMAITPEMSAGGARPVWLGYIGVDDVDASAASILAAGGAEHMPAMDVPGVGRMAMLADPQGVPFYIMKGASGETSHAFAADRPRSGHCAWNELVTTDQSAALSFYTGQFGWRKDGEMEMGPMGKYEFLRHGSVIGAIMTKPPEQPTPSWNFYFRVPDISAAATRIKSGGGRILNGPQEVPGGDWVINGLDPQGASFALVGQKS
jgi:uncharacterized protein